MARLGGDGRDPHVDFQRALLDSARLDGPSPEATRQAWGRFSASIGVAAGATGAGLAAGGASKVAAIGATRSAAIWILFGALAGGAATSAWLGMQARGARVPATIVVEMQSSAASIEAPAPSITTDVITTAVPSPVLATANAPTAMVASPPPVAKASPATTVVADESAEMGTAAPASSLEGETAALESALSALRGGRYAEALALVAKYRAQYSNGVLARDVDVVAIEALAAEGDRTALIRAASLFLDAYPDDPHAARVRWLVVH
jgi:hypothetical protein